MNGGRFASSIRLGYASLKIPGTPITSKANNTMHLTKRGAEKAAERLRLKLRGGYSYSSGWSRLDYGVRKKYWHRIPYYETYVRASEREYYRGT